MPVNIASTVVTRSLSKYRKNGYQLKVSIATTVLDMQIIITCTNVIGCK